MTDVEQTQKQDDEVSDYYRARAADARGGSDCCSPQPERFGPAAYQHIELGDGADAAALASLGCGNPLAVAELREGETVLDLGSGAGLDLILSARRVGSSGLVYGLEMLDEMLVVARDNIADADVDNVILLKGYIEAIPLPVDSVDVIISNCVINLSNDKQAVAAEMQRVVAPGGRIGLVDVVAEDRLSVEDRASRGSRSACVAGALSISEYRSLLTAAGFGDIDIQLTQEATDGIHSAMIRATLTKPSLQGCCDEQECC